MRRLHALLFLGILLLNGMFELSHLAANLWLVRALEGAAHAPAAPTCHSNHAVKACTGCCGDSCTRGAACQCGKPGKEQPKGVMFLAPPSCHINEQGISAYPPASLGFQFLKPAFAYTLIMQFDETPNPRVSDRGAASWLAPPDAPPPRTVA